MNFGLDFGSIGIVKNLCLVYVNVFMMYVEKLVGMCKLCFMDMAKFCGYVHGYFCGYEQILWVCDVDSWEICVVMILAM